MAVKGNTRKTGLEQYYTPDTLATKLCALLAQTVATTKVDKWLEPAAGTGSFCRAIRQAGYTEVVAMDVEPKKYYIKQQDFLTATIKMKDGICLTNPPFGRNHSLSVPFFNKAAEHCRIIAFIVPRSWRKWSIVNRHGPRFHKVLDQDMIIKYVDENGKPLSKSSILNTVFQIWERRDIPRPRYPEIRQTYFKRVRPTEANGSLTIFGRGCGTLKTTFPATPNTTQMFIKAPRRVIQALPKIDLSPFYTQVAYVEALSIVEINYALTKWFADRTLLDGDFLRQSTLTAPERPSKR